MNFLKDLNISSSWVNEKNFNENKHISKTDRWDQVKYYKFKSQFCRLSCLFPLLHALGVSKWLLKYVDPGTWARDLGGVSVSWVQPDLVPLLQCSEVWASSRTSQSVNLLNKMKVNILVKNRKTDMYFKHQM